MCVFMVIFLCWIWLNLMGGRVYLLVFYYLVCSCVIIICEVFCGIWFGICVVNINVFSLVYGIIKMLVGIFFVILMCKLMWFLVFGWCCCFSWIEILVNCGMRLCCFNGLKVSILMILGWFMLRGGFVFGLWLILLIFLWKCFKWLWMRLLVRICVV